MPAWMLCAYMHVRVPRVKCQVYAGMLTSETMAGQMEIIVNLMLNLM